MAQVIGAADRTRAAGAPACAPTRFLLQSPRPPVDEGGVPETTTPAQEATMTYTALFLLLLAYPIAAACGPAAMRKLARLVK